MKKFLLALSLSVAVLFSSCSKNDSYYDESSVMYAVMVSVSDLSTDDDIIFSLDNGDLLFLEKDLIAKGYKGEVGDREVIYFNVLERDVEIEGDGETIEVDKIKLLSAESVILGDFKTVETEEESDEIVDQYIEAISSQITFNQSFLNLYLGFKSEDGKKLSFSLVENNAVDPDETSAGYLNLELRFNSAGEELKGNSYTRYVSFDVSEFEDRLEDMKGIILRYKSISGGVDYVKIAQKEVE